LWGVKVLDVCRALRYWMVEGVVLRYWMVVSVKVLDGWGC